MVTAHNLKVGGSKVGDFRIAFMRERVPVVRCNSNPALATKKLRVIKYLIESLRGGVCICKTLFRQNRKVWWLILIRAWFPAVNRTFQILPIRTKISSTMTSNPSPPEGP